MAHRAASSILIASTKLHFESDFEIEDGITRQVRDLVIP